MSRIGWKNGERRAAFAKRVKHVQNDAMCVRAGTVLRYPCRRAPRTRPACGDCGLRGLANRESGIVSRLQLPGSRSADTVNSHGKVSRPCRAVRCVFKCEQVVLDHDRVRGVVIGGYGEWSMDVEWLLEDEAARTAARRDWSRMGLPGEQVAYGLIVASYRRRMGVIAVREMARHRYRQSQFAGLTRLQLDEVGRERQVQQQGSQRAEALAERSVEIAPAMVPLAGALARGGG